jgi:hypothetical protein
MHVTIFLHVFGLFQRHNINVLKNFPNLVELSGSLPHPQTPAILIMGLSNPVVVSSFHLKIRFSIIHPSMP